MARPRILQQLTRGRLLTGRNFPWFVATWNWLTRYVDNLQGDADGRNEEGYITLDRSDPDNPVIRFRIDKLQNPTGKINVALPWTYDPLHGWLNPKIQVGANTRFAVSNTSATGDGAYYVDVDFSSATPTASVVRDPASSPGDDVFRVYVGTVYNGEQTDGIYSMPVCYHYL